MYNHPTRLAPLSELFSLEQKYTAEDWLEAQTTGRALVRLQEYPDLTIIACTGIFLPPHERTMIHQLHRGAGSNVVVASRGTAKSSTVLVLYATYCGVTIPKRKTVTLSATGFRGGQLAFQDIERWMNGGWESQEQEIPFFRTCVDRKGSPINKGQSHWTITFDSHATNSAFPTKNEELILGIRGNDLNIDEAKHADVQLIDKIAIPFLNVKGDFRHGGKHSEKNRVFYTTTVDYSWRPFMDRVAAARAGLERDYHAVQCAEKRDLVRLDELDVQGLHEHTYTQFDYTDLLIRRFITNREGKKFEVMWPDSNIDATLDRRGIPFLDWDDERQCPSRVGNSVEYFQTYPIDKDFLERGLRDGSTDEAIWKSENRNILDHAVGDVYSNQLIDEATCDGDRCLIPFKKLPAQWQEKYEEEARDYIPPVLWRCIDPCVLGIDYAPSRDFCAFVIIRMGPLAQPCTDLDGAIYNPFTHQGKTKWSNVIWCEQHLRMTYREVADKVRTFRDRYNLHWVHENVKDTWQACRAIGLDMRGGGNGVRDELVWINEEALPEGAYRIYDPLDADERIVKFSSDPRSLPMLDAIWPSDPLNDKLVEYTVAQMQQGLLYLPKFLDFSQRPPERELHIGYDASRTLERQLRKLRQKPTKVARTFYMEGDTRLTEHKKDLWASFIYAAKQLRAHLLRQAAVENTPPPQGARVAKIGTKRRYGRAPGARD